jgi:hypothetical protein
MFFLAMHGVTGDDKAGHVEFFQQLLNGGDFIGFVVDLDMRQYQRCIDGERAEHLFGLGIFEVVKATSERLAIEGHDACVGTRHAKVQADRVLAKGLFDIRRSQPLQNITDGSMGGRSFPADFEGFIELSSMDLDEGADAAVRVRAADNRQNGKQQNV